MSENDVLIVCVLVLGKPFYNRVDDHIAEESSGLSLSMNSPSRSSPHSQNSESNERFSRKVFVGGLPPDIDEGTIVIEIFFSFSYEFFFHVLCVI